MAEQCLYAFKDKEVEIGIDEAGRGPVLGKFILAYIICIGPMVYACCFWPIGVKDDMKRKYGFTGTILNLKDDFYRLKITQ